jgi:membrane protease YdiL (CAAX protease family)
MKSNPKTEIPRSPKTDFRAIPWRLTDIPIVIIPLVAIRLLPTIIGWEQYNSISIWIWLGLLIFGIVWMSFAPLWLARLRGAKFNLDFRSTRIVREVLIAVGLYFASFVFLMGLLFLWVILTRSLPDMDDPLSGAHHSNPIAVWIALIFGVTVAPIAEEIAFRGFLYSALRQRMPILPAAILQALAFGFLHAYGAWGTAIVILIGFALALAYEWRKTLLVPVTMHLTQNAIVLIRYLVWISMAGGAVMGVQAERIEGGCRIIVVTPGSGAEEAGLQVGDIVQHVEDIPVYSTQDIRDAIHSCKPGETVWVGYVRDDVYYEKLVRLKPKP